ncbi:hypothetical protein [Sphingomonas sp. BK580]|uniref:hypothetical protein n=1 Tax=Sphingomonas sp. BK580 TaxID=2586972 RepID=UPI0016122FEB|nr:hypothetical protein [Sphingomonas sp. BK580]MBB3694656.1 hypothetical protein [Sphingomonas sp. BK580]
MHAWSASWLVDGGWALLCGALGFCAKAIFDSAVKTRDQINLEVWKVKARILEQRLSGFYWPLFSALQRDTLLWQKVFNDLRSSSGNAPAWLARFSEAHQEAFSRKLEMDVLIPNHQEAVRVIRSNMHLANADVAFNQLLGRYVRHVDVYVALRQAGLYDVDPIDVGEEYPHGLTEEVEQRMLSYQEEYEKLLRGRGVTDLRDMFADVANGRTLQSIASKGIKPFSR